MAITAVDEYCMREIERFPVKRTTYRAQLFFTVSSIPFDRSRLARANIYGSLATNQLPGFSLA